MVTLRLRSGTNPEDDLLDRFSDLLCSERLSNRRTMHEKHRRAFWWSATLLDLFLLICSSFRFCERAIHAKIGDVMASIHG